jgi:RNA polymerase sigma-70 factor (ECF subfamily)
MTLTPSRPHDPPRATTTTESGQDSDELGQSSLDELLALVATGSSRAFEAAYPQMAPVAYGVAWRVLGDTSHAEEVAQEALVDVWVQAADFDPARGPARSWVAMIARRRAIDRVRMVESDCRRDSRWSAAQADRDWDPVATEAATTVDGHLDALRVRRAMATLSQLQRDAIELAFFAGMSYPQVAVHLGIPLGTAKTRMRDGLIRLGAALSAPPFPQPPRTRAAVISRWAPSWAPMTAIFYPPSSSPGIGQVAAHKSTSRRGGLHG